MIKDSVDSLCENRVSLFCQHKKMPRPGGEWRATCVFVSMPEETSASLIGDHAEDVDQLMLGAFELTLDG